MSRLFLSALAGALVFPSALPAQPLTVCIFQTAPAAASSDAATLAPMLSVAAGPGALTAIPIAGIPQKDRDAEAHQRSCAWIVELERDQTSTPGPSFDRDRSGGASEIPPFTTTTTTSKIAFTLRQSGSKKICGHGSSSSPEWAALFPAAILRNLPVSP